MIKKMLKYIITICNAAITDALNVINSWTTNQHHYNMSSNIWTVFRESTQVFISLTFDLFDFYTFYFLKRSRILSGQILYSFFISVFISMYATKTILIFAKAYRNVFSNYLHTATAFNIHHYLKTVRTYKNNL